MSISNRDRVEAPTWGANVLGLLLVLLGGLCITSLTWIVREVSDDIHPLQAAFMRYAFGTLLVLPLVFKFKPTDYDSKLVLSHILRGLVHAVGVLLWFYAVTKMLLADLTALSFTSPVFVTLGAFIFLGEKFNYHRLGGIILAFSGAMIVIRPGIETVSIGAIAILISSPLQAFSTLIGKHLVTRTSIYAMVFYLSLFVTIVCLIPTLFVWNTPSISTCGFMFLAGALATIAHFCWAKSFKIAELSFTQPGFYFTLIWAAGIGYFGFDEKPDVWSVIGALVIVGATAYISTREKTGV